MRGNLARYLCASVQYLCLVGLITPDLCLPNVQHSEDPADQRLLRVEIYAVSHFTKPVGELDNPNLNHEFEITAQALKKFFQDNYRVPVTLLSTPEETTKQALED